MNDIDFYGAKPGDVCNQQGDIRGKNSHGEAIIISRGEVHVRPDQVAAAEAFGWSCIGLDDYAARIRRI